MSHAFSSNSFSVASLNYVKSSFVENFLSITAQCANDIFIVFYDKTFNKIEKTYADFKRDVISTLKYIDSKYPEKKSIVVISKNNYSSLVVYMAGLLSNKILCPLNPDDGSDRLQKKIRQLNTSSIIYCFEESISLDFEFESKLNGTSSSEDYKFEASELSKEKVLIFTSGSTGYSKIVKQSEMNILTNINALISHHQLNKNTVVATPLPLFHVNALYFSFLSTFFAGGRFVLFEKISPRSFLKYIDAEKVNILSVIPSILQVLLLAKENHSLVSLKYFVSAAAPLSVNLAKNIFSRFGKPVIQGYGLSEAVNFSLTMPTDLQIDIYEKYTFDVKYPSVGIELFGNSVDIFNFDQQSCAPGITGEIVIKGWNVMAGYKDETDNPIKNNTLYTGDLGYYELDALTGRKYFFITGRKKDIVKRFGETISLRELDELLMNFGLEGVDLITVPFENTFASEEIAVVCRADDLVALPGWRNQLELKIKTSLPDYLKPHLLCEESVSLRTASGKPMRWAFQNKFDNYNNKNLGPNPIWIN